MLSGSHSPRESSRHGRAPIRYLLTAEPDATAVSSTPPSPAGVPALRGTPPPRSPPLRARGHSGLVEVSAGHLLGLVLPPTEGPDSIAALSGAIGGYCARWASASGLGQGWADADRGYRRWRGCGRA